MDSYQPINCNYYDILEGMSTRKVPAIIQYKDAAGEMQTARGLITNLYTKEGVEYLELDGQLLTRLDLLVSVNNAEVPD